MSRDGRQREPTWHARARQGYRDAQCGWCASAGATTHLAIYAPRRGLLELWAAPHGPRVAAVNVGGGCALLCPCAAVPDPTEAAHDESRGTEAEAEPDARRGASGRLGLGSSSASGRCFLLQPSGQLNVIRTARAADEPEH